MGLSIIYVDSEGEGGKLSISRIRMRKEQCSFYKSLLSNHYALCLVLLLSDFFKQSYKIKLAKNTDKIHLILAHTQPIYRPLEICTGCKSIFRKIFEFKIWKESMLVLKQTIPQKKALVFSFKMTP